MTIFKKTQLLFIVLLIVVFSGCIKKLGTDGLTLKIEESQLNNNSKKFPIKRSFIVANVEIEQPHVFIKENTNKIAAQVDIKIAAIFLPKTEGSLQISGNPYFNKEDSAIYLKDVEIENLELTNTNLGKQIPIEKHYNGSFISIVHTDGNNIECQLYTKQNVCTKTKLYYSLFS